MTKKKQTNKATAKKTSTRKGDTSHPGSPSGPRERAAASDGASAPTSSKPKKSPFTRSQLNPLRKALYELRARIGRDLNLMSDEALRAADPEVDADDVADFGSDAFERTMTLGLMENESKTLQKIDVALEAMEAGTYGLCAECNEAIPLARLQALPFAEFCVPCQEQQERWG